jgi:hypothetical protein
LKNTPSNNFLSISEAQLHTAVLVALLISSFIWTFWCDCGLALPHQNPQSLTENQAILDLDFSQGFNVSAVVSTLTFLAFGAKGLLVFQILVISLGLLGVYRLAAKYVSPVGATVAVLIIAPLVHKFGLDDRNQLLAAAFSVGGIALVVFGRHIFGGIILGFALLADYFIGLIVLPMFAVTAVLMPKNFVRAFASFLAVIALFVGLNYGLSHSFWPDGHKSWHALLQWDYFLTWAKTPALFWGTLPFAALIVGAAYILRLLAASWRLIRRSKWGMLVVVILILGHLVGFTWAWLSR